MILKNNLPIEGILPVNKSKGKTSFSLIRKLRHITNVSKIGHCGTLDPLAAGVMIYLIGKNFTKQANQLIDLDKEYLAQVKLGFSTTTYDMEGEVVSTSDYIPTLEEITSILSSFQGTIQQVPPMFSAKKIKGKKLYEYARQNQEIPREAQQVHTTVEFESYEYPYVTIKIQCSKGFYVRSYADDLGKKLQCGATLFSLTRTRIGSYHLKDCLPEEDLSLTSISKHLTR